MLTFLQRNCLVQHVITWKIDGTIRCGLKHKQLLDHVKEKNGCRKLKEEALGCAICGNSFGRGYVPVVRQT